MVSLRGAWADDNLAGWLDRIQAAEETTLISLAREVLKRGGAPGEGGVEDGWGARLISLAREVSKRQTNGKPLRRAGISIFCFVYN